jgi:hypothetical protein
VHWLSNADLESHVKGLLSGLFVHIAMPGISLGLQSLFWLESYMHVPPALHEAHMPQSKPELEHEPQTPAEQVWVPAHWPEPHAWVSPSSTEPSQSSSAPLHVSVAPGCIAELASLQSSSECVHALLAGFPYPSWSLSVQVGPCPVVTVRSRFVSSPGLHDPVWPA